MGATRYSIIITPAFHTLFSAFSIYDMHDYITMMIITCRLAAEKPRDEPESRASIKCITIDTQPVKNTLEFWFISFIAYAASFHAKLPILFTPFPLSSLKISVDIDTFSLIFTFAYIYNATLPHFRLMRAYRCHVRTLMQKQHILTTLTHFHCSQSHTKIPLFYAPQQLLKFHFHYIFNALLIFRLRW